MRKLFFWLHLILGTTAAIVVFIMSVTGVLLMYERQMIAWADRGYQSTAGQPRLAPEVLFASVQQQAGSAPSSLTIHALPDAAAEAVVGTKTVFVDTATGKVLGESAPALRRFFRAVTDWHRWLAMQGESRNVGRAITGAANLMFFILALSGIYLWLPRKWLWQNVRAVLLFRGGLAGKARDFNWHNVIGIWSAIPLVFVILGALVISYPWATALVYRAAGDAPPAPPPAKAAPKGGAKKTEAPARAAASGGGVDIAGLDRAWQQAEARVPGWQSIAWRPAPGNRVSLSIMGSHRGRVDLRSTLTVDRVSGEVIAHETFDSFSRGRQWRSWLRFIHTGEALGFAGQTIAGIVSAGAAVLVWTGLALTWRRFRAWQARQRSAAPNRAAAA